MCSNIYSYTSLIKVTGILVILVQGDGEGFKLTELLDANFVHKRKKSLGDFSLEGGGTLPKIGYKPFQDL